MAINVHVENLNITPESVGFIVGELERGVSPEFLRDVGENVPEGMVAPVPLSPEEEVEAQIARADAWIERDKQSMVDMNSRRNHLRNVAKHASTARGLEGFQTNHQNRPSKPSLVSEKQFDEKVKTKQSLQRACGVCAVGETCVIKGNLERWLDYHPYADDRKSTRGKKRPGSSPVPRTESRQAFLKRLEENPLAHCIPQKSDIS